MTRAAISESLRLIFQGIEGLKDAFPNRAFTIDGRLVGDVGEVIAAREYDVVLHDVSQPNHDATTTDGRNVQIKATFKDSLTFKTVPDYYLGFKLYTDGPTMRFLVVRGASSMRDIAPARIVALRCCRSRSRNYESFRKK